MTNMESTIGRIKNRSMQIRNKIDESHRNKEKKKKRKMKEK